MDLIAPKHGGGAWYREAQPYAGYGGYGMMYRDYVQLSGYGTLPGTLYEQPMPRFGAISSQPSGMEIPGYWPSGGMGQIYSHTAQMTVPGYHPEPSDIPGYWRGLGFAQGTQDAQAAKSEEGASESPAVQTGWLDVLKTAFISATGAYQSHLRYETNRDIIKAGQPPVQTVVVQPTPVATTVSQYTPPPQPAKGGMNWGLVAGGGALLLGALFVLPKVLKK